MAQARLERLMNVVAYLSNTRRPLTLKEIVGTVPGYPESVGAARRAFERDKEDLRAMNFDIALEDTPEGESGYRIRKENTYFDVKLTSAQRSIVEYALALYGPEKRLAENAVTKLGGMNPENIVGEVTSLALPAMVDDLYSAASGNKTVCITFRGEERVITPQRIIARSGYWYVQAHDQDKNQSRTFRIDRILDVKEVGDQPITSEESETMEIGESESVTFVVRVHPSLVEQFCATWSGSHDMANDTVQFTIPRKELFLTRLYEYSGFVAILEPHDIAGEVAKSFEKAQQLIMENA